MRLKLAQANRAEVCKPNFPIAKKLLEINDIKILQASTIIFDSMELSREAKDIGDIRNRSEVGFAPQIVLKLILRDFNVL